MKWFIAQLIWCPAVFGQHIYLGETSQHRGPWALAAMLHALIGSMVCPVWQHSHNIDIRYCDTSGGNVNSRQTDNNGQRQWTRAATMDNVFLVRSVSRVWHGLVPSLPGHWRVTDGGDIGLGWYGKFWASLSTLILHRTVASHFPSTRWNCMSKFANTITCWAYKI